MDYSRYIVVFMYSISLELLLFKNVWYMFELGLLLVFSFIDYLFIVGIIYYIFDFLCIYYFIKFV